MKRIQLFTGLLLMPAAAFAQVVVPDTTQRITSTTGSGVSYDIGVAGTDGSFSIVKAGTGQRLTIDGSGNVTVLQNLTVNGTFSANGFSGGVVTGGASGLSLNAGGTNQSITLTPSGTGYTLLGGNVGIGTSTPDSRLKIDSAIGAIPTAGLLRLGGALDYSGQTNNLLLSVAAGVVSFDAPGVPGGRLKIDASGNIGIGNATPTAKLDVVGTAKVSGAATVGGDLAVAGKIGIGLGATAPGSALHVKQDARIEGNLVVDGVIQINSGNVVANTNTDTMNITSTIDSTGYANGALTVAGGVGIAKNLNVGGILNAANLQVAGQAFNPANYVQQSGGVINGGATGLTINAGATNQNLIFDADGTGRVEVRDLLAITNFTGIQYLLMGNQDSAGANNPAILRASNGNFEFGHGNSWVAAGGGFTPNVTFLNNGNVGIGTSSPAAALDVIRPGNANVYENGVRANRPDAQGQYAFMGYGQSSADAYFGSVYTGIVGTYGSIHLRQYTAGMVARDVLNIDGAGNVGIGTTTPAKALDVQAPVGAVQVKSTTGTAPAFALFNNTGGDMFVGRDSSTGTSFFSGSSPYAGIISVEGAHSLHLGTNGTVRMTVDSAGAVGIGTNAPTKALDVQGSLAAVQIKSTAGTNPAFTLYNNTGGDMFVGRDGGTGGSFLTGSSPYAGIVSVEGPRAFHVGTNNAIRMTVDAAGNVGIGTTNPSAKLDVAGSAHVGTGNANVAGTTVGLSVQNTSGDVAVAVGRSGSRSVGLVWRDDGSATGSAELYTYGSTAPLNILANFITLGVAGNDSAFILDANSNVGIGTNTPLERFEVNGNAVITGALKTDIYGNAVASLSLGSSAQTQGGTLRFLSNQGYWGFANNAGTFSLARQGTTMLSFGPTGSTAVFAGSIQAPGMNVQNSRIINVAAPTVATDGANKKYVDDTNPFQWGEMDVFLKHPTDYLGLGTSEPDAPLHIKNAAYDGEVARFQHSGLLLAQRSYLSLYAPNDGFRWEFSLQDHNGGGDENGFALRARSSFDGISKERIYISPNSANLTTKTYTRFYNQNPNHAWNFEIDQTNALFLHGVSRDGGDFSVQSDGLYISPSGQVGIGLGVVGNTDSLEALAVRSNKLGVHKLAVNGSIRAKEVVVETGWADYVFADDYKPMPLAQVEEHIKEHKHLPGVPSAQEVAANGVSLGQMQSTLLAKIEELTLHMIEQEKRIKKLEAENVALRIR